MPVSGIVLTLTEERESREGVLRRLRADARVDVGPADGCRVAIVLVTDSLAAGRDLCEQLVALPGIDQLEVAYVAAEDEPASAGKGAST